MSKQSSIEFLFEKLEYTTWMRKRDLISEGMAELWKQHYLEQAKAMHRKEHGLTWDKSIENFEARGRNEVRAIVDFDDYYNQTFEQ